MPLIPNPYYLIALQWALRNGAPIVIRRLSRASAPTQFESEPRFQGDASLERGGQNVRGLLAITDTELRFEPWDRRQGPSIQLPLEEIENVTPTRGRVLGLVPAGPTGIKVRSRRGIFRFGVDASDRNRWLREIPTAADPVR
jgi:hypothetical protein